MTVVRKKTIAGAILGVLSSSALYLIAFHGECNSSKVVGGAYEQIYYTKMQYFFDRVISQREWSEPEKPPNPPPTHAIAWKRETWRGFGLLWKTTDYLE